MGFINSCFTFARWCNFSCELITEHLKLLRAKAEKILSPNSFSLLSDNVREEVSKINNLPGIEVSDLEEWKIISELLITKNNSNWRKKVDVKMGFPPELKEEKNRFKEILDGLNVNIDFKDLLISLEFLLD